MPSRMAIGLLCACLFLPISSYGQTPTPSKPSEKPTAKPTSSQRITATNQRGTEKEPLVIRGPITTKHTAEDAAKVDKEREEKSAHDEALVVYTGQLAKATMLLAVFTLGLMIYTAKLWGANKTLVEGARETAVRQLRSYVGIEKASISSPSRELQLYVTIKNSGQTPAYNIRIWHTFTIFDPLPHVPSFDRSRDIDIFSMLGANALLELKARLKDLSDDTLVQVRDTTRPAYIWGEILYRDVFREERHTTFRLAVIWRDGEGWVLRPTPEGNQST